MSHSLATLRLLLQDELFVCTGQTMRPTARALALAAQIRDALRRVQDTLRQEGRFDPGTRDRTFHLGFSSELEVLVLPALAARLRHAAPSIRLLGQTTASAVVMNSSTQGNSIWPSVVMTMIGCGTAGSTSSSSPFPTVSIQVFYPCRSRSASKLTCGPLMP